MTTKCDCNPLDKRMFQCWDCAACTNCSYEYYMVHDGIWDTATEDFGGRGMLCIGCLENRLGGLLTKDDFTSCVLNEINLITGSPRLKNRLTQKANAVY